MAFILLSAILDDTLGLKSPTTVQIDIDMTKKLNELCNISDLWEYSKLLFKKKDIWNMLSPRDIIEEDLRNVEFNECHHISEETASKS